MDNLGLGFNMAFVGITVVFLGLILLALIIYAFPFIFKVGKKSKHEVHMDHQEASRLEIEDEEVIHEAREEVSQDELVAVLTAAVMASMGNRTDIKIKVKSFRRIPEVSPVWNTYGRREQMNGKL